MGALSGAIYGAVAEVLSIGRAGNFSATSRRRGGAHICKPSPRNPDPRR